MKRARHLQSGKLVEASEVSHIDYTGMLICPTCQAALTHREGYITSSGKKIYPAFVHPSYGTPEQKNCSERVNMEIKEKHSQKFSETMKSKNQFYELLRKKILKALFHNSDGKATFYCKHHMDYSEAEDFNDFLDTANSILGLPQNGKAILDRKTIIKEKTVDWRNDLYLGMGDFIYSYEIDSLKFYKLYISEESLDSDETKIIIDRYVKRVLWFLEFLIASKDENLRYQAIDLVFGGLLKKKLIENLPVNRWSQEEYKLIRRVSNSRQLSSEFYTEFYNPSGQPLKTLKRDEFNTIVEFHRYLFDALTDYFIRFTWPYLFWW